MFKTASDPFLLFCHLNFGHCFELQIWNLAPFSLHRLRACAEWNTLSLQNRNDVHPINVRFSAIYIDILRRFSQKPLTRFRPPVITELELRTAIEILA